MQLLLNKGDADKKIIPFDDEFYDKLNQTYISGLPVSIHIKYLKPIAGPGKCYDRSLYMFFCFDDAILFTNPKEDYVRMFAMGFCQAKNEKFYIE